MSLLLLERSNFAFSWPLVLGALARLERTASETIRGKFVGQIVLGGVHTSVARRIFFTDRRVSSKYGGFSADSMYQYLTLRKRDILLKNKVLAPRDGFEISEKTSRILGVFHFSSLEIPPKAPLLKAGCRRKWSDD
jgi:hypothetical protein